MAYTTITDWADGDILSATKLNQLLDNIEYLNGRVQTSNPARVELNADVGDGESKTLFMEIVHLHNNLEFSMAVTLGTIAEVDIRYDATTLWFDHNDRNNGFTYSGTENISADGLTIGQLYQVRIVVKGKTGSASNSLVVRKISEEPL